MLNEILKLPSTSSPKRSSTAASSPEDLYRPVPQAVLGRVLLPCLADGPTRVLASSRTSAAASLASPPSSELGMEQDLAELRELKTADQCLQVELATLPVTQACVAASKLPGEPGRFLWSSALPSATPPNIERKRLISKEVRRFCFSPCLFQRCAAACAAREDSTLHKNNR